MRRHLLGLRELSRPEIEDLLDAAQGFVDSERRGTGLRGTTVASLFYEPSTRTELSFDLAARRLGAEMLRCDIDHSSVQKGESLLDTARTIEALGVDALVIRHPASGAPWLVARHAACAVINAGDGMQEHPTQGLVDLLTVRQRLGRIADLKITIVGDVRHSRVARSAAWGFSKLGAQVTFVGPQTLLPRDCRALPAYCTTSPEEGLDGADVVMALRMQLERQAGGDVPSLAEYASRYGVTERILARTAPDAIVMHPGPINAGIELGDDVACGPGSVIHQQVRNGVHVRMAVLEWVLDAESTQSSRSPQSTRSPAMRSKFNGDLVTGKSVQTG
jgi:aspartate carbamoyltransferase catalytic subunit